MALTSVELGLQLMTEIRFPARRRAPETSRHKIDTNYRFAQRLRIPTVQFHRSQRMIERQSAQP